jgi:hypothetical protein
MMLVINAGLGLGVAAITALLGIPDPFLWGMLTLILSFAPYIGELAASVISSRDGFSSIPSPYSSPLSSSAKSGAFPARSWGRRCLRASRRSASRSTDSTP